MFPARNFIRYFDLQSENRPLVPMSDGANAPAGAAPVIPQYLAAVAGVIVEPFLRHYVAQGGWQIDFSTLIGRVTFGLIIGIMILPAVYKQAFDPQKPILVQLAAIFPMGIGWQSLVGSSAKFLVP